MIRKPISERLRDYQTLLVCLRSCRDSASRPLARSPILSCAHREVALPTGLFGSVLGETLGSMTMALPGSFVAHRKDDAFGPPARSPILLCPAAGVAPAFNRALVRVGLGEAFSYHHRGVGSFVAASERSPWATSTSPISLEARRDLAIGSGRRPSAYRIRPPWRRDPISSGRQHPEFGINRQCPRRTGTSSDNC